MLYTLMCWRSIGCIHWGDDWVLSSWSESIVIMTNTQWNSLGVLEWRFSWNCVIFYLNWHQKFFLLTSFFEKVQQSKPISDSVIYREHEHVLILGASNIVDVFLSKLATFSKHTVICNSMHSCIHDGMLKELLKYSKLIISRFLNPKYFHQNLIWSLL